MSEDGKYSVAYQKKALWEWQAVVMRASDHKTIEINCVSRRGLMRALRRESLDKRFVKRDREDDLKKMRAEWR